MKTKNPMFNMHILKKMKMKNLLLLPLFLFALSCSNDLDSESPLEEFKMENLYTTIQAFG